MAMSVSVKKSTNMTNIKHNNRKLSEKEMKKNTHIDTERSEKNVVFTQVNLKELYKEEFGEALEKYNDKQKRSDRKIDSYYDHIKNGKKTSLQQEMIFQVGDTNDFSSEEKRDEAVSVLTEYYHSFKTRNPNLKVYNAVIHNDEASPHLHLNFVPVAEGYKRGLEKQVSFDRAIIQQDPILNKAKPFQDWREKEAQVLASKLQARGIERKIVGTNDYKDVNEFKEKKDYEKEMEKELQVLAGKVAERKNELLDITDNLPNEIKKKELKKEVKTEVTQKIIGKAEITETETENFVLTPEQLEDLLKYGNDGMSVNKEYQRLLTTDLVKENISLRENNHSLEVKQKETEEKKEEAEFSKWWNEDELDKNEKQIKSLESKVTELKDEILYIYSGARDFVNSHTSDVSSGRKLFESFKENVKEQFSNARKWYQFKPEKTEFEKLDKVETDKQRNSGRDMGR